MFKITGLDKLQKDLQEAQTALKNLDEELGTVSFDPADPESIEAAIQSINGIIDERAGQYTSNSIVASTVEQMKEKYRDSIIEKAAQARLQGEVDK